MRSSEQVTMIVISQKSEILRTRSNTTSCTKAVDSELYFYVINLLISKYVSKMLKNVPKFTFS